MKKHIAIAVMLGLAAIAARGQTATLTAPQAGVSWAQATTQAITWTWKGAAQVKLVLVRQGGGKLGVIKSGLQLSAGAYSWKVGTLEDGTSVPAANDYLIRISTMDSKILNASPVFAITAPGQPAVNMVFMPITQVAVIPPQSAAAPTPIVIKVTQPAKGTVWIPLKTNYALEWEWIIHGDAKDKGGPFPDCSGCRVHVWMVPVAAPSQKVLLTSNLCCGWTVVPVSGTSMMKFSGTYAGLTPSLATGNYFFRVAWSTNQGFYGDSQPFAVKSVISDDSAYLGPDPLQGEVDFALNDVFFDADGNLALKIKNLGKSISGGIPVSYERYAIGNYYKLLDKGETGVNLTIGTNEEKNVTFFKWAGYRLDEDEYTQGKYIPGTTRPFLLKIKISTAMDVNSSNNSISKELCFIKEADIGTDGEIKLIFSPKEHVYINRGTSNKIHEAQMKWISKDTFEAEIEVGLWNYGGAQKSFDIWLYVDKLPGQLIQGGISLQSGHKMTWKQTAKIKVPSKCGDHSLVLIADPGEAKNQPYPNSYMNNFIPVTLKIVCGGTVTGGN